MPKLTIYILELENGKYYVGRSTCSKSRILQHFNNNGSEWTKLHKPIRIISQIKTNDPFDEEKHTLLTMDKYGIDNVRGGSYCTIELSKNDKKKALQTIASVMDRCYKCNEYGHFSNECPDDKSKNERKSKYEFSEDENVDDDSSIDEEKYCKKCGWDHFPKNELCDGNYCGACSGSGKSYWCDDCYGSCLECCCINCGNKYKNCNCHKCNKCGEFMNSNECDECKYWDDKCSSNITDEKIVSENLSIYEILKDEIRNNTEIGEDIHRGVFYNNENPDCDQCGDSGFWWTGCVCWFCHCETCNKKYERCICIECETCEQKILNEKYDEHKFICCRFCKREIENVDSHECMISLAPFDWDNLFSKTMRYIENLNNYERIIDSDGYECLQIDIKYETMKEILLNIIDNVIVFDDNHYDYDFPHIKTFTNLNNMFELNSVEMPKHLSKLLSHGTISEKEILIVLKYTKQIYGEHVINLIH